MEQPRTMLKISREAFELYKQETRGKNEMDNLRNPISNLFLFCDHFNRYERENGCHQRRISR